MIRDWDTLYDMQDQAISGMNKIEQGFYLTGGTALSRGYYHHRRSEDLDFFVNDSPLFGLWRDRCFAAMEEISAHAGWHAERMLTDERFGRFIIHGPETLKVEFVNDVPSRVGSPERRPVLGMLDTKENILANKITALVGREEPKDAADVYWLCCEDTLNIMDALTEASGKAAGIFPPLVARELDKWRKAGLPDVIWLNRPAPSRFADGLARLVNAIMP